MQAFEKIFYIAKDYPLFPPEPKLNATDCFCHPFNGTFNETILNQQFASDVSGPFNWTGLPTNTCAEVIFF